MNRRSKHSRRATAPRCSHAPYAQLGIPAGKGVVEGNEIPYQPWALAKKLKNFANRRTADPETKCYLPGVPRITYMPYPFQIIQSRDQVTIVYEYIHTVRYIYMNGSPHPRGHKVFTRPWKMSMPLYRRQEKNVELLEYECYSYALEEEWKK